MKKYSNHKESALSTFIDFSKCFDNVNHLILGQKLLNSSLGIDIMMMLMDYLRNQKAIINWLFCFSDYKFIDKGVRQGRVLPPFLFNFYISDIVTDILDTHVGYTFGGSRCNILAYPDDLVLFMETRNDMSTLYNRVCLKIKEHDLEMSKTKKNI